MTIYEYLDYYKSMSNKACVENFNSFSIAARKDFLSFLSETERTDFINKIRSQAVSDFWTHEQELIKCGQSTRNWTPEQIESILNLSEKTGKMSINGDAALTF